MAMYSILYLSYMLPVISASACPPPSQFLKAIVNFLLLTIDVPPNF